MKEPVRVRFAPSPTGPFHIGGARSALFNWLLAKNTNGRLILRIEDTDLERSTRESEENIKAALRWLGITWDEGVDVGGPEEPYRQSERLDIYRRYTEQLLKEGKAYRCYCTAEELEASRQKQLDEGKTPIYDGHCAHLTPEQEETYKKEGRVPTIRLRCPQNETLAFEDLVRGHVSFESNGVGDFIIVKSDGMPVYNYGVVIDDARMQITHVIRAEEHLSNTPRQLVIYRALGFKEPKFGHISLILGKDHKKMSKRHGATAVEQYKNMGYLPEAIINFLALLGWSSTEEKEIYSVEELIQQFSMDHVSKNPAVFDIDKLNWINFHYMQSLSTDELVDILLPQLQKAGFVSADAGVEDRAKIAEIGELYRKHLSYGEQIIELARPLYEAAPEPTEEMQGVLAQDTSKTVLEAYRAKLENAPEDTAEYYKAAIKEVQKETGIKGKDLYMPLRIALIGAMHGPDIGGLVHSMGKTEAISRLSQKQ